MKWQTKLTVAELDHLKSVSIGPLTLANIEDMFAAQLNQRVDSNHNPIVEPCWECKAIARKLGFPV